jgi:AraC-like DNA-binding protein
MSVPLSMIEFAYKERDRSYHWQAHAHRAHQWYVCVHGDMLIDLDGKAHTLRPEQSLIVLPGTVREPRCRLKAPGYIVALFTCEVLDLSPIAERVLDLPFVLREDFLALVEELRSPHRTDSAILQEALLIRLLVGHKRAESDANASPSAPSTVGRYRDAARLRDAVAQADRYMELNFSRDVTRAEIANAANLSEPHLARLHKAATGRTLGQRLTELRVAQAKHLLLQGDIPVTVIAGEVGFSSFSHFAKVFRKAVGVAPSDYRRAGGRLYQ